VTRGDERKFRENPGDTAPGFSLVRVSTGRGGEFEGIDENYYPQTPE
jgi:hypothetical protein